jgi:hypothetical protein
MFWIKPKFTIKTASVSIKYEVQIVNLDTSTCYDFESVGNGTMSLVICISIVITHKDMSMHTRC